MAVSHCFHNADKQNERSSAIVDDDRSYTAKASTSKQAKYAEETEFTIITERIC